MHVPAAEYTDERIWKQEVDSIFKSLPIMVGASQEIPDPSDIRAYLDQMMDDIVAKGAGVDVFFDNVGGATWTRLWGILTREHESRSAARSSSMKVASSHSPAPGR